MEVVRNDENDDKLGETLLKNRKKIEIVKKRTRVERPFSPFSRQLIGCSASLLGSMAVGNVVGYSATLLRQLKNDESKIELNVSEESWIASISTLAMAIACIFAATLMEKFGRRSLLRNASALFFVCWMILYFSVNFSHLLFGRFMTGFCAGLTAPTLAVYVGEITQPSYRGFFLSLKMFCGSLGVLTPHTLGLFLGWEVIAVICALVPLLGFLLLLLVPESPPWLVRRGRIEEAGKSFTWLRGQNLAAMDEFEKIVEGQTSAASSQTNSKGFHNILTIVLSKSFYKPLTILCLYNITIQASGPSVLQSYTMTILRRTIGGHMNEYVAAIILDVTKLVTAMVACVAVKNVGRRPLTAFSGLTTAGTLLALSAYLHYASMNERLRSLYGIPLALYTLYILFIVIGLLPLAVTLTQELLPLRYRAFGSSFVILFNYFCTFVAVKISPALFQKLGESGVYLAFAACCFVGTMIILVFLPETRNKTLQEIEDSYRSSSVNTVLI